MTNFDETAARLHGVLDQAVSVILQSLYSATADPMLAMAILDKVGVLERSRALGRGEVTARGTGVEEDESDKEVERILEAVDGESDGLAQIAVGGEVAGGNALD